MSRPFINVTDPGYDDYAEDGDLDDTELEYQDMYFRVGHFIAEYSTVELAITALLAIISDFKDLEAFHTLTKGMDAKTKVERLRELAKTKKLLVEKGLFDSRLMHFADKTATLRNKVAHAWLLKSKGDPQKILFSNIAKLPFDLFKMKKRAAHKPDEIIIDLLWEHTNWLSLFQTDIISLIPRALNGEKLELKNPGSMEPKAFLQHLLKEENLAKRRTQRQSPKKK